MFVSTVCLHLPFINGGIITFELGVENIRSYSSLIRHLRPSLPGQSNCFSTKGEAIGCSGKSGLDMNDIKLDRILCREHQNLSSVTQFKMVVGLLYRLK